MEEVRIRISSKIAGRAIKEGWSDSLAIYIYFCKEQTSRRFFFKKNQKTKLLKKLSQKHRIGFTMLCKHFKVLEREGLLTVFEDRLIFKKNIRGKYKYVFIPHNINNLKDIKLFLFGLPIISNLVRQEKKVSELEHYNYIQWKIDNNFKVFRIENKAYLKYRKKHGQARKQQNALRLSYEKIMDLTGKFNRNTITKIKRLLVKYNVLEMINERRLLTDRPFTLNQFRMGIKSGDFDGRHFYFKGNIYESLATKFSLAYRLSV